MTYVIGLESHGMTSIISDARVTRKGQSKSWGENVVLKTGLLFPGCIFGRVGNAKESKEFILKTKYSLTPTNTVEGFWHEFERIVDGYNFPKSNDAGFKLLLSTRHSGKPEFYLLDSRDGLSRLDKSLVTFGSGKAILDDLIQRDYAMRIREITEALSGPSFQDELPPYLLCLWLTELSQSAQGVKIERHGVGGVFHFVFQTDKSEHTQKPSLYVLADAEVRLRTIYYWQYRVCFVNHWLVIDALIPPGRSPDFPRGTQDRIALLDEASLPPKEVGEWNPQELYKHLQDNIESELEQQPFYFFCGIGYTNPKHRRGFGVFVTTKGDYIFTEGRINPEVEAKIIEDIMTGNGTV